MKVFTQEEFDALPIERGYKQCPAGDYSQIKSFGEYCIFDADCSFGGYCHFDTGCRFGANCDFDEGCRFGADCSFGMGCRFGVDCSFGADCRFGKCCSFEDGGGVARAGNPLLQFDRIGSRTGTTQFFNLETGILVRCGCQQLFINDFRQRVLNKYGEAGHGLIYLGLCNVAEEYFRQENERANHAQ